MARLIRLLPPLLLTIVNFCFESTATRTDASTVVSRFSTISTVNGAAEASKQSSSPLVLKTRATSDPNSNTNTYPVQPGSIVHLFPRYGYLSLSMRIVSRNETDKNWLFLEPSKFVFEPGTFRITASRRKGAESATGTGVRPSLAFQNAFHIDVCENVDQLLQAYFAHFQIEGSAPGKSWKAFAGGWQSPSVTRFFGIDMSILNRESKNDLSFVLVRLLMAHGHGKFEPLSNITATPAHRQYIDQIQPETTGTSTRTLYNLFNRLGSHHISSYITGNSIFQVFVFDKRVNVGFDEIKRFVNRYRAETEIEADTDEEWQGQRQQHDTLLEHLPGLLTSWATHISKVMTLNANAAVTKHVQDSLQEFTDGKLYHNIFRVHDNRDLLQWIQSQLRTQHDGLIGFELKSIDFLFRNQAQRSWYTKSLKQTIELWETNL